MKWSTVKRKISDLIPYEQNPREMTKKQVKDLEASLNKYDLVEIPAINTDNTILAGHQRLNILGMLGRQDEEIDVRIPDRLLTHDEAKEYNYRSNLNTGQWDEDILASQDKDWLRSLGFDENRLNKMFGLTETEEDEAPEKRKETDIAQRNLFVLGEHRLLCGDATRQVDVEHLANGNDADMVFTDPPYGMNLDTDWSDAKSSLQFAQEKKALGGKKYERIIGDDKEFNPEIILNMFDYCKEVFLWGFDYYAKYLPSDGSLFVWDKRLEESADKMYGSCFELCWSKNKHKKKIVRIKWAWIFGTEKEFDHKRHHPTQKPIALSSYFINKYCKKNDNVFDLFGGSGSTLIACEQLNRKCYMMELDPIYCQVIVDRWGEVLRARKHRGLMGN